MHSRSQAWCRSERLRLNPNCDIFWTKIFPALYAPVSDLGHRSTILQYANTKILGFTAFLCFIHLLITEHIAHAELNERNISVIRVQLPAETETLTLSWWKLTWLGSPFWALQKISLEADMAIPKFRLTFFWNLKKREQNWLVTYAYLQKSSPT